MKRFCLPIVLLLLLGVSSPLEAKYYKWVDEEGNVNLTNDPKKIPAKYREQVKDVTDKVKRKRRESEKKLEEERVEAEAAAEKRKKSPGDFPEGNPSFETDAMSDKEIIEKLEEKTSPRTIVVAVSCIAGLSLMWLVFLIVPFTHRQWGWGVVNFFLGPVLYLLFGWKNRPLSLRIPLALLHVAMGFPLFQLSVELAKIM